MFIFALTDPAFARELLCPYGILRLFIIARYLISIFVLCISYQTLNAIVATTREIGLEVSADKTKHMVMSRDQNAGRIHSVRIDNSTFERVEVFKYLGTTLTNQNSIVEEIKSRLRSGSACYHLVQNLLSSRLLSKNLR